MADHKPLEWNYYELPSGGVGSCTDDIPDGAKKLTAKQAAKAVAKFEKNRADMIAAGAKASTE